MPIRSAYPRGQYWRQSEPRSSLLCRPPYGQDLRGAATGDWLSRRWNRGSPRSFSAAAGFLAAEIDVNLTVLVGNEPFHRELKQPQIGSLA
jgi:hypothetical protein